MSEQTDFQSNKQKLCAAGYDVVVDETPWDIYVNIHWADGRPDGRINRQTLWGQEAKYIEFRETVLDKDSRTRLLESGYQFFRRSRTGLRKMTVSAKPGQAPATGWKKTDVTEEDVQKNPKYLWI